MMTLTILRAGAWVSSSVTIRDSDDHAVLTRCLWPWKRGIAGFSVLRAALGGIAVYGEEF
jgi:hypothetical protein